MTERVLGAAIIGLGVGENHVAGYQKADGVRPVAIADISEAALARVKERYAVPFATTNYREAIDHPEVDVVSICTPDRLHAEQAIYAMEHGKHVLVEKPIGISLEQLGRLIETVRRTGVTFACCHNYRFRPDFSALRDMLVHGDIGQPFLVDSCYFQDLFAMQAFGPDYWRFKDPQDLFLGGAVHNVDLVRWLAGEVAEVHSYANKTLDFWPVENNNTANLQFQSGAIGHVYLQLGSHRKTKGDMRLRAFGPLGSLEAAGGVITRDIGEGPGDQPEVVTVTQVNSHHRQVAHLVECIRTGKRPEVDVYDGARTMAVCLAVVQSARTGKPVQVEYLAQS
jgi:predicted dehydrogenase